MALPNELRRRAGGEGAVKSKTANGAGLIPTDSKSQVQVIARAAAILRVLEEQEAGLSLGQIAQRVGLARSTVQRIVNALAAERFLISASPTGRVVLGPALLRLANNVATSFTAVARPYLLQLSSDLKETVDLAAIKKDRLIFIDQVEGSHRLRTVSAIGEAFPLHCTANGKAYLATLDDGRRRAARRRHAPAAHPLHARQTAGASEGAGPNS